MTRNYGLHADEPMRLPQEAINPEAVAAAAAPISAVLALAVLIGIAVGASDTRYVPPPVALVRVGTGPGTVTLCWIGPAPIGSTVLSTANVKMFFIAPSATASGGACSPKDQARR